MKPKKSFLIAFACALALSLIPGVCFAADASANGTFTTGKIAKPAIRAQSISTQSLTWVDGGYTGSCDWDVYNDDGWYYLFIAPRNGSYGWIESTYYVEATDGSDAPWYQYSDYLKGIKVSGYVLASESCNCMFCDCPYLEWVDLSGLDTSEVTDMQNMFFGCKSLSTIWVTTLWSTDRVLYSGGMFTGCYCLEGGNGTMWSTNNYKYDSALWANVDYPDNPGYFSSLYLGDAVVSLSPASYTYDSTAKTPSVTVSIGKDTLESSDYSIAYSNNVNVGTGTVTVTASNDGIYEGSISETFTIQPGNISNAAVTLSRSSFTYTGKNQTASVKSVSIGGRTLKQGTDFTISSETGKNVGSYTVTVFGKGNYAGSKSVSFKINQAPNSAKAAKTAWNKDVKSSALKKNAQNITLPKVTAKFGKAKWKVTAKDKKNVLRLSGNKIIVKKGAKKGKYTIKVKAQVTKTKNYKAATTKVVTVKVTVK